MFLQFKQVKAQLKAAVKQQKIDSRLLEDHALKETAKDQSKRLYLTKCLLLQLTVLFVREHYSHTITKAKAELERFKAYYKVTQLEETTEMTSDYVALG